MPSNWTAAFTHPDPLDPNDVVRQKTQARAPAYPYDQQTSYGKATQTSFDQDSYQDLGTDKSITPRDRNPDDPKTVWDNVAEKLNLGMDYPKDVGPQSNNAVALGYGKRGMMGEDEFDEIEFDISSAKNDFSSLFWDEDPEDEDDSISNLFSLLSADDFDCQEYEEDCSCEDY